MAPYLTDRDRKCLEGVHPDLVRVVERAAAQGGGFRVIEGVRTVARQRELVARGASKTMNSRHIPARNGLCHAVDVVPLGADGNISWAWPDYYPLAERIKRAAKTENVPIEWGGDWKNFKDGPHWQLPWKAYPGDATTAETPTENPWSIVQLAGLGGTNAAPEDFPYEQDTVAHSRTIQASSGIGATVLGMIGSAIYGMNAQTLAIVVVAGGMLILALAFFIGRERIQKMFDRRFG